MNMQVPLIEPISLRRVGDGLVGTGTRTAPRCGGVGGQTPVEGLEPSTAGFMERQPDFLPDLVLDLDHHLHALLRESGPQSPAFGGLITTDRSTTVEGPHGSGQSRCRGRSLCPNRSTSHAAGDCGVVRRAWGAGPRPRRPLPITLRSPGVPGVSPAVHPFTGVHSRGCLPGLPRAPSHCQPPGTAPGPDRVPGVSGLPHGLCHARVAGRLPPPTAPSCSGPFPMRESPGTACPSWIPSSPCRCWCS